MCKELQRSYRKKENMKGKIERIDQILRVQEVKNAEKKKRRKDSNEHFSSR